MATIMKARFPLLLLLGIVFLASVSVTFGIAYWEQENPSYHKCLQSCNSEIDAYRHGACEARCKLVKNPKEQEPQRERARQEGEKEEERRRHEDPEERVRRREEKRREKRQEREEEEEEGGSESPKEKRNPYLFRSNRFQTWYENEHGSIRVLQRFDKRSNQFENLQNYRVLEYNLKPNTLLIPQHSDADFLLVVVSGQALVSVVNPNDRDSYKLEKGDALRIHAGTTSYLANRDDNQNLRVVQLAIPVNRPGKIQPFSPSDNEKQQSYFRGFSKNILEASFNAEYDEIEKILLGEEEQQEKQEKKQQSEEEGLIVQVSKEQIQELSKHAKSSSRKSLSSEDEPFNLRSRNPIYSNKFGKFFEIPPKKNPQLEDLDVFLSCAEINEGALMLPHYNSEATVLIYVVNGEGSLELVGPRQQQQQQEQEQEQEQEEEEQQQEVQRYRAKLSQHDVIVVPAGHPLAVSASSDLHLLGFGINAENNQRNFLAGENDNVISQIQKPVKEITFPGSAEDVDRLIRNQKHSYFASAKPQQEEQGRSRRSLPLSSILGAFY